MLFKLRSLVFNVYQAFVVIHEQPICCPVFLLRPDKQNMHKEMRTLHLKCNVFISLCIKIVYVTDHYSYSLDKYEEPR